MAETKKAAQSVISAFRGLKANFLVQDFVKEANGEDIRCLVIDNRVVASIKRTAAAGDFRSNLHQGGTAKPVRITKAERDTALRAAKAFGLKLAGVDLLRSKDGLKVLEVNSSLVLRDRSRDAKTSSQRCSRSTKLRPAPMRKRRAGKCTSCKHV